MGTHTISIVPVTINAPAKKVWDVLTDIDRYSEWNPFTIKARSIMKVGEPITLYIATGRGGKVMKQEFVLETIEPPSVLAWRLPKIIHSKVFNAYRVQVVAPVDDNRCTYTTSDTFEGWLAGKIFRSQHQWIQNNFLALASALKARAEQQAK